MNDSIKMVKRMIRDFKITQRLRPTDKIRVSVDFSDGRQSVSTGMQAVNILNAARFFDSFSKVFQSVSEKDDMLNFSSLTYKFICIKMPVGGAYLKIIHNKDIYKKKCTEDHFPTLAHRQAT